MKFFRKILAIFFGIVLFIGCSNEREESNVIIENGPNKIYRNIVSYDPPSPFSYDFDPYSDSDYFSYNDKGNLIRVDKYKSGDYIGKYSELSYNGNEVLLESKSDNGIIVPKNSTYFTIDNLGRIKEKYIPVSKPHNEAATQRYLYEYDNNGRLFRIYLKYPKFDNKGYNIDDFERVDTFYYKDANLVKIISQSMKNYKINSNIRLEEIFSDYDNTKNPFKKLKWLDFYFYRSLSENNFRNLKIYSYDENNVATLFSEQTWSFVYDKNNNLLLYP